ncbi:crotonase [Agrobacterium sp. 13-626]|nr:crotonase [Agrobacterium sp. 13-626]
MAANKFDLTTLRTHFDQYADKYQSIKMRREDGILEVRLHTNDGPLKWGRLPHAELEEAFLNIGRDRENQVVILTGTGDQFSGPRVEDSSTNRAYHRHSAEDWAELGWESKGLLNNLLGIEVPMIAAVNGPAVRHPELPIMCDIVLAAPEAEFQDSAHYQGGLVPGDGVHVVFSMVIGLNRARYFLMTGQVIGSEEAKSVGLINEIVPSVNLLDRAWEHARQLLRQPAINRRFARVLVTEQLRRQIQELLPYGLALEALAAAG